MSGPPNEKHALSAIKRYCRSQGKIFALTGKFPNRLVKKLKISIAVSSDIYHMYAQAGKPGL
jgi:hypothetical protein